MTSFLNMIKPTEKSIQKEYVQKRQRALERYDPVKTESVKKQVEALLLRKGIKEDWLDAFRKMAESLARSDLTINFDAIGWFSQENNYATYAQMYDRATKDGKMTLKSTGLNPALARTLVDDLITIPDDWADAHRFSQRRRLRNALHASGANHNAVRQLMNPSQELRPNLVGSEDDGYTTTNKLFMPKAKQVFAGLNYGRRVNGATTEYGYSYLVLRGALKESALYYAGDTFYTPQRGAAQQSTYNTIGGLLGNASPKLSEAILESCYQGKRLASTSDGYLLVEAHIFKTLKVAEDVQALVLSRMPVGKGQAMNETQWKEVVANAAKWCTKNKVIMVFAPV